MVLVLFPQPNQELQTLLSHEDCSFSPLHPGDNHTITSAAELQGQEGWTDPSFALATGHFGGCNDEGEEDVLQVQGR